MTIKMKRPRNDEVHSESEEEYEENSDQGNEDENETAHQAKIRLTKQMIAKHKEELKRRKVENIDEEVRKTYEEEALDKAGKIMKDIAANCIVPVAAKAELKKNKHYVTCLTYSEDGKFIFTGGIGGDVCKWDPTSNTAVATVKGGRRHSKHPFHRSRVTAIAACDEFVATGDVEHKIFIWTHALEHRATLTKHRKEITSLAYRRNTQQLFSGDTKGVIFVWEMALMNTIEELLGHESAITGLDSNLGNSCVSCSGIGDPCVKVWKLDTGAIAAYSLPKKSTELALECVAMLNERFFVAGSANNKIYLWDGVNRKSPSDIVSNAHDLPTDPALLVTKEVMVVAIGALRHTRVFASGSNTSQVKVWHLVGDSFKIQLLFVLPGIAGCINALRFSPDGHDLAVGVCEQHKRNRMQQRCPGVKQCIKIYNLFK